jgi:hypothetical protein
MAIFPDVPGLQAEVVVDGEPLAEYDDDDDNNADSGTITKYIEALSNKEFALRYTLNMDALMDYGVQAKITVDDMKCHIAHPPENRHNTHHRYGPSYLKDGQHVRQHYRFTALNIGKKFNLVKGIYSPTLAKSKSTTELRMHKTSKRPWSRRAVFTWSSASSPICALCLERHAKDPKVPYGRWVLSQRRHSKATRVHIRRRQSYVPFWLYAS